MHNRYTMDIRKIKKLIKLIHESNIATLEISEGNQTIRITRSVSNTPSHSTYLPAQKKSEISEYTSHTTEICNQTTQKTLNEHVVRSPMVGILYLAPHIDAQPFVSVGKFVRIGDTLCIIEAMKIMNQIQSDISGTIKSILRENSQPIEFDEPLFIIYDPKK